MNDDRRYKSYQNRNPHKDRQNYNLTYEEETGKLYYWDAWGNLVELNTDTPVPPTPLEPATPDTLGGIKTDPSMSIYVTEDGKLVVGGRLGQVEDGGVFYPDNIEPTNVGASSFLMTDGAKNLDIVSRSFDILAGANITCKSATAGAVEYRLRNTQGNRAICTAGQNGRLSIDQNDAKINGTKQITSIMFANGDPISFYFGIEETDNDIIITVEETVNPDASTTKLRIYGTVKGSDTIGIGQGVGIANGKSFCLGQSCYTAGNQTMSLGNSVIVIANNSVGLGHTHLVNKQFCFCAGQGHDFTNATNGANAVGICSELHNDTAFAVGAGTFNGNGNIIRKNALEVTKDGGVIVPSSTNGSDKKFKITVDDSGTISATEII